MIRTLQELASSLRNIAILAVAFSLGANAAGFPGDDIAGAAKPQGPVLRVQVDLQSIAVRVTDKQGRDVRGLSAEDFTVLEDGQQQKIAFFGAEKVPTSLTVLIDSSSSMDSNGRLGSAEAVAARFMRSGREGDEISAMDFTDQFGPFQQLTQEQLLNPSSVPLVSGPGRGSALYDAMAMAVCHLRASKNLRKAIVVITDGDDQQSRISLEQLIALLQASRVQVFMVGWHMKPELHLSGSAKKKLILVTGGEIDNPSAVFERLGKETGAESVFPTSDDDMDLALKKVSGLLEAEYTLAYYPVNGSNKFRRIEVKTKRPGLVVTVRRGVGSDSAAGESIKFVGGSCEVSPQFHPYPYESKMSRGDKGIAYRDTFSDSHSGWPNREGSRYAGKGYELSAVKSTTVETEPETIPGRGGRTNRLPGGFSVTGTVQRNVVAAYGPWWRDFRVSAIVDSDTDMSQFRMQSQNSRSFDEGRPSSGLVFRLGGDGYYAVLVSGNQGSRELWLKLVKRWYENSAETEIAPWSRIDLSQKARGGIRLGVEAVGDQITIFVNDQEVKRVQDGSFPQGYVGFVLAGAERAIFRDLVVEQVP